MSSKIKARIYHEKFETDQVLSKEHSHYLMNVLRSKIGDHIALFNPEQGEACFEIIDTHPRKTRVKFIDQQKPPEKSSNQLWLAFAPIKKNRLMFLAEKISELGVDQAYPILTEFTDVRKIPEERFKANLIEASEQCERLSIPKLHPMQKLETFLNHFPKDRTLAICAENHATEKFYDFLDAHHDKKITFLVGPEGGFSPKEFELFKHLPQAKLISLGPRILRAETATIAALSNWQMMCGGWR